MVSSLPLSMTEWPSKDITPNSFQSQATRYSLFLLRMEDRPNPAASLGDLSQKFSGLFRTLLGSTACRCNLDRCNTTNARRSFCGFEIAFNSGH